MGSGHYDLHNSISVRRCISPDEHAADDVAILSQVIDRRGFESCEFVIATGLLVDADATFTVLIQAAIDLAFTVPLVVPDADLLPLGGAAGAAETAAGFQFDDDDQVRKIGYIGPERFVRMTITPAGPNTGLWDMCVICLLGNADRQPVTQLTA